MPSDSPPGRPLRLILWLTRPHLVRLGLGSVSFIGAAVTAMTQLWIVGKVVDEGLIARSASDFALWIAVMALLVVAQPIMWTFGFRSFQIANARGKRTLLGVLSDHLNRTGTGVRGRVTNGEMVNLASDDTDHAAQTVFELGFLLNNTVMFITGAVLVWSIHPLLGAIIVFGSAVTGLVAGPLLNRLQRRQSDYRAGLGALTAQSADIVGGLRILRGIGGDLMFDRRYREHSKELRDTGYRVASSSSWIHALRNSMPVVFVAAITWTGALLASSGSISFGELTAAFGFATIFIGVVGNFIGTADYLVRHWVGTKRVVGFLAIGPDIDTGGEAEAATGTLHDPESSLTVEPGSLTVVVTDANAPALAACERLARHRDSEATWGGTPLAAYDLAEVRERIMLLTDEDYLFADTLSGTLRAEGAAAREAIATACADDVHTSLGSRLDARIAEGGRNLSGGQRQRLRLARAVAARPETLLAVEPTSAVDAHTESLVAARVAEARAGLTTLVVTSSPLWIAHADRVVRMEDGAVIA